MSLTSPDHAATRAAGDRRLGRRALLGLAILTCMSGAAASLLYNSIMSEGEFVRDPDTAARHRLLMRVTSFERYATSEDTEDLRRAPADMLVFDAAALLKLRLSAAQKLIEGLQATAQDVRRPVLAALNFDEAVKPAEDGARALDSLVSQGVDGVFLDCGRELARTQAADGMPELSLTAAVVDLVARARQLNPNFIVVIENAAELAGDPRLARLVDGVARDDVLFGADAPGLANKQPDIVTALHDLNRVKRSGGFVFVTERLAADAATARAGARQTFAALGFVSRFAPL